ncbi:MULTISPECIES: CHC2 zinc finger domain-containing protein [unclassified Clostridioides]|uniref:CHC2 zinc finger domain-containing protein n=1 Tax=unclassified Clostridioides TaxID=2635829 RepID=UPI001D126A61|nr:DUF3854 domain-containing protein [Clostridioides sp. ES-S-0145-01]MCC0681918.1 DUF3854 domain-containing protein [Clostridioides sp. ES-S-0005-03]MCC0709332.1 DUF3854 domain-containing protein [Clostridioides sp. ES-S-0190-01]UDN64113.1 DUF3854 domain-containing protein [Clostridioides sp. ES-W-0016-02]
MKRKDFIKETIELVREVVGIDEIESRMDLKNGKGLCPFHHDKRIGSFSVSKNKKIFKCFSCGVGGDIIKFVSLFENITYVESAFKIALEKRLISEEKYKQILSKKLSESENLKIEKTYIKQNLIEHQSKKADNEILNKIYSLFIKGFDYLGKNRLNEEDVKHLKNKRGLTDKEIEDTGYFSFPNRYILKPFLADLEKNNIKLSTLNNIPGFFYNEKNNRYDFTTIKGGGIAIPIRNEFKQIVGIQIRKNMVNNHESRYIWFSSAFAQEKEGYKFGTSAGVSIDVIYPKELKVKTIFITEGHFKAKKIAKEYNSIAISIQGVCAWGNIVEVIKNIQKIYSEVNLPYIYIAFDADMGYNLAVYKQALKLGEALREIENKKIFYVLWDSDFGKGIDDLIDNGKKDMVDKISFGEMNTYYNKYIEMLISLFGSDEKKYPKETKKELYEQIILRQLKKYKNI